MMQSLQHGALGSRQAVLPRTNRFPRTLHVKCAATPKTLSNKGWWKPQRLPPPGPTSVPDSYPSKKAREATFSVCSEQPTPTVAEVKGQLPDWLSGSLIINGAGDYSQMEHMFDGLASLTKVEFKDGKALASQRFLQSQAYLGLKATGQVQFREFLTSPPKVTVQEKTSMMVDMVKGLVLRDMEGTMTDNGSVNVLPLKDGSLYALSEIITSQYRVDPITLDTLGPVRLKDSVPGNIITAHPSVLPDGTIINFSSATPFGAYTVFKQDPTTLERTAIATIPHRGPFQAGWIHDFVVTDNYAVLVEPPLYFNLGSLTIGEATDYVFLDWKPKDGTRVHVVPLDGSGKVRSFLAPPLFAFHYGNAFESDNGKYIYVDFSVFDDPEILNDLLLKNCRRDYPANISPSGYRRLTIPLADEQSTNGLYGEVSPELLIPPVPLLEDESTYNNYSEFPAVNPLYNCKPYRYTYMMSAIRPTNLGNAVAKVDLQDKSVKMWHEPGGLVNEPMFIPKPGGSAEDEGVVAFAFVDKDAQASIVVLDGQSFEQIADVQLPFQVTMRFHGTFIPSQ